MGASVTSLPPPITADWVFYVIAILTVVAALGVVIIRNVIHAALSLAACFFGVAAIYVLLHAQFLAVAQVLIYVGDITVLILFALMLTRGALGAQMQKWGVPLWAGVLTSILLAWLIISTLVDPSSTFLGHRYGTALQSVRATVEPMNISGQIFYVSPSKPPESVTTTHLSKTVLQPVATAPYNIVFAFSQQMMTTFLLPFEVASGILLMALVGAIVLAREERPIESR